MLRLLRSRVVRFLLPFSLTLSLTAQQYFALPVTTGPGCPVPTSLNCGVNVDVSGIITLGFKSQPFGPASAYAVFAAGIRGVANYGFVPPLMLTPACGLMVDPLDTLLVLPVTVSGRFDVEIVTTTVPIFLPPLEVQLLVWDGAGALSMSDAYEVTYY